MRAALEGANLLKPFRLHEPTTVGEAVGLLREHGDAARLYAGGTELLLAMKAGFLHYDDLVNVKTIAGLDRISQDPDGTLHIGPAATHAALESSPLVAECRPLLADVEHRVANVRVRNVGTIGGNICFAEPHSDPAAVLVLSGARLELTGPRGTRMVRMDELQTGPYETVLADDEMLTDIVVQHEPDGVRSAYLKFGYHHRPTLGIAVDVILDAGGTTIEDVRVALGSVPPVAFRVRAAEDVLKGERAASVLAFDSSVAARAGEIAAEACGATGDLHGSAEYKRHLVEVLVPRAVAQAIAAAPHLARGSDA
jgi:carbon-monoxide dehydrogenase medium subunit